MNNSILHIKAVSKFYTGKIALKNIHLEIPKGTIYGLLGPNGAGKTSLIRIINQITEADEGTVYFKGETLKPEHIRYIGYLPEERGLYKKLKVIKQLEYFAQLRGMSSEEAKLKSEYWLKRLQLLDVKNKKVEELSKGMQQKIQFIVAIINEPELLILDEPFSGFDPINAELITEIILELKANGCTILFSTHRMESVEKLCDHLAMIHQSEKILDGKLSDIKQQFKSDYYIVVTEELIDFELPNIEIKHLGDTITGHQKYQMSSDTLTQNEILLQLSSKTQLVSFSQHFPSINDIFIQLANQNKQS
jgi:ABC-2 type transport system ATP-binding protein